MGILDEPEDAFAGDFVVGDVEPDQVGVFLFDEEVDELIRELISIDFEGFELVVPWGFEDALELLVVKLVVPEIHVFELGVLEG